MEREAKHEAGSRAGGRARQREQRPQRRGQLVVRGSRSKAAGGYRGLCLTVGNHGRLVGAECASGRFGGSAREKI